MPTDIVPVRPKEFSFYGQPITIVHGDDDYVLLGQLCAYMGLDTQAQQRSLERQAWAEGKTAVTAVQLPGETQSRTRYIISTRVVGMWLATITASRIQSEESRLMVERYQRELADKIHDWLTESPADDLALPTDYLSALKALVQREEQNLALEQENAELTPRAIAWDAIASAEGDYSVGEAAKMLAHAGIPNMGPTRLFSRLEDIGWTFRAGGAWQAKADRVEKGFLSIKPQFHYHPGTGQRVVDPPQVRVTLKGVEQLRRRLGGGTGTIQAVAS